MDARVLLGIGGVLRAVLRVLGRGNRLARAVTLGIAVAVLARVAGTSDELLAAAFVGAVWFGYRIGDN